jgi:hypothetical protein
MSNSSGFFEVLKTIIDVLGLACSLVIIRLKRKEIKETQKSKEAKKNATHGCNHE